MSQLILEASHLIKTYGLRTVLDVDRLEIYDGDRIGLIGENGAGKSTLMGILAGEISPDTGSVRTLANLSVIRQTGDIAGDVSDTRLRSEFGVCPEHEGLSGGEKTRRRIASALEHKGCLLLADEPTTDLDTQGVALLEKRLIAYPGAVLLISHDRTLLDNVCNRILCLEDGRLTAFPGNYSDFFEQRKQQREFQQFEYEQYRREQSRLQHAIQQKIERAGQVHLPNRMGNSEARLHKRCVSASQSRQHAQRKALESRLNLLEEKQRPRNDPEIRMALGSKIPVTSKTALEVRGMTIRFGKRTLLSGASMSLPTGSKTALLGPNGCGKTSLIRRIVAQDHGVKLRPGVRIGWFDQDHEGTLNFEASALQNAMDSCVYDESTARTVLARLNLRGDDVFKRVGTLSGGERAKIALARLMLSDANLLILDEPTNHLDVFTMSALEDVLSDYQGTLLFVSHDRAFVEHVADRLVLFSGNALETFEGNMEAYRAKKQTIPDKEKVRLEISTLQIRMATLSSRMDAPRKGDDSLALREEFFALAAKVRDLQNTLSSECGGNETHFLV